MQRTAVYPATLDPIHNGHSDIAIRAAKIFDQLIVAVYDVPKKRLLFDADERVALAKRAFADYSNIRVTLFSGLVVNYARSMDAMALIRGLRVFSDFEFEFRYHLANKKLAPEIETVAIMADEGYLHVSSSTIREVAELGGDVSSMVPPYVQEALTRRFEDLKHDQSKPSYMKSIRD
jgi:pantetheine-phosphate adenylyltransferase